MAGNKVLLDTNIISALLKGDTLVADHIDNASEVYISSIVIGELFYGAEYSVKIEQNIANIKQLIAIASAAVQHKLKLSTRDKHFLQIKGLKTLAW
jgi:tRNA(fMet)-specific endonuclease VapC